jgi:hypothetical protein
MFYKIIPINNWYFKFIAPFYLKKDFEYETKVLEWNFYLKRYVYKKDYAYLFSNLTGESELLEYWFGWGWSSYILYHYEDYFDEDSKEILKNFIDPIQNQFKGLRKNQQEDLNDLLKFRRGIFQVYTGYGKTQIIAHLVNYIINIRKERLLLLTPNSKALNEIDNRVSELFGITHNYFDYNSNYNAINTNGFPRSSSFDKNNFYWNTVRWIIAEEAEYIMSNSGTEIIELCKNALRLYAFSATADKTVAERIRMREGNIPVVQRNKNLINYFGFSSVFRKPKDFIIHIKEIATTMFNDIADNYDSNSEYTEIIYATFTDKKFCNGLLKIIQKEFPLYIPMGRLEVIDYWIKNYFKITGFVVINICGRGYELYISGEHKCNLKLEEVKDYIEDDQVHLITGTSSSYRALDFPKLDKIIPLTSKLASLVIQAIGRVTRSREFTIINLKPFTKINIYTNDYNSRKELILNYYSDCKIITTNKKELDYGIT